MKETIKKDNKINEQQTFLIRQLVRIEEKRMKNEKRALCSEKRRSTKKGCVLKMKKKNSKRRENNCTPH